MQIDPNDPSHDDRLLAEFGYQPELKRALKSFESFAIVFSYISVATGIFATYGSVINSAGPRGIWSWPIVTGGQLIVALVIAALAGRVPITGLSYQWMTRLTNPSLGWILGWAFVGYGLLTAPAVNVVFANIVAQLFGLSMSTTSTTLVVLGVTVIQAVIMIFSTRITMRINNAAVWTELVSVTVIGVVLIVVGFATAGGADNLNSHEPISAVGYWGLFGSFASTVVLGAFTFSGFDSAAALADETEQPQRAVPLGIIRAATASAVLGMVFLIAVTVAGRGDWAVIGSKASPVGFIAQDRLGTVIGDIFIVCVGIAVFANSMLQTTVASRLIWAISRDGRFPASHVLRKVQPSSNTPANAILLATAVEMVLICFLTQLNDLLVASALIPIGVYGSVSVAYVLRRHKFPVQRGGFSLGRFDLPVAIAAVVWSAALVIVLVGRPENHKPAIIALAVFASGLIWWGALRLFAPDRLKPVGSTFAAAAMDESEAEATNA